MKAKSSKFFKIIAFLLCFLLCIEQSGFAQIAGQLDISGHLAGLRNAFVPDVFRPLHLRYLSYNPLENNFQLFLDKGSLKNPNPQELQDTTKMLLNYFFIGIALPNDTFWVNLRPDAEDNIIDEQLAQTDVGKILLESDLQLKKDTARFTSPETHEGREYWDKLYQKAGEIFGSSNITIPTLTRPWIVPDEIIIRETPDSAYIYKATLKVMLEQDYLKDSAVYNFKDDSLKELNEYSSKLIREIIIPKLTKEVNSSKRYASLRQVYYSLIMAQWFKARYYGKGGLYSHLINRKDLTNLTSKESWSKTTYFKEYRKSFKDGEYNIKEQVYTPYGQVIGSYFSGGISGIAPTMPTFGATTFTDPKTGARITSVPTASSPVLSSNVIGIQVKARDEPGEVGIIGNEIAKEATLKDEEADFGIAADNQAGLTRQTHEDYHTQGLFAEIINSIGEEIGASKRPDGLYDLRSIVRNEGRRIETSYGELRIENDDILVIIDNRFQRNHAGRGEYAVYARSEPKARHELMELRLWKAFAIKRGIATEKQISAGELGLKLRNWMNGVGEQITSEELKERRDIIATNRTYYHNWAGLAEIEMPKMPDNKASIVETLLKAEREKFKLLNSPGSPEREKFIIYLSEHARSRYPREFYQHARYDEALNVIFVDPEIWNKYNENRNGITLNGMVYVPEDAALLTILHEKRHQREQFSPFDLGTGVEGEISAYFGSLADLIEFSAGKKSIHEAIFGGRGDLNELSQRAHKELEDISRPNNVSEEKAWREYAKEEGISPDLVVERAIYLEYERTVSKLISEFYDEQKDSIDGQEIFTADNITLMSGAILFFFRRNPYLYNQLRIHILLRRISDPQIFYQTLLPSLTSDEVQYGQKDEPDFIIASEDDKLEKELSARLPLATEEVRTTRNINPSSSSPMDSEDEAGKYKYGGIDFRSLPIVTQAMTNLSANISSSALQNLVSINLDEEWLQIEKMASSGITPSSERIKEYVQTSCAQDNIIQDRDKILLCISDILRLEEERCDSTDATLRDILIVLESGSSVDELKEIFLGKVI